MTTNDNISFESKFLSNAANDREKQQRKQIKNFKNNLKQDGVIYSSVKTKVNILDIQNLTNDTIAVKVRETSQLYQNDLKQEMQFDAIHKFLLKKNKVTSYQLLGW